MTIICLEGASAIGKSTAAQFMAREYGYIVIPEVNQLFTRSMNEPYDWYFHMQQRRWEMAKAASESGKIAILDGDHLQPVWYNWIFNDANLQSVDEVLHFYATAFIEQRIAFPDSYVVLHTDIETLRQRKEHDNQRKRRNFNKHLRLIEPQRRYFEALKNAGLPNVNFLDASSPNQIASFCASLVDELASLSEQKPPFEIAQSYIRANLNNS